MCNRELTDLQRAKYLSEKMALNLTTHITSMSFSSYQLVQMVAVNLYAMHHARKRTDHEHDEEDDESSVNGTEGVAALSKDEQEAYDLVFSLTCK